MTPEQRYQYNKIIDILIKQRKDQGLTIEKLAMEIGTDTKTLGDWERKNKSQDYLTCCVGAKHCKYT